MIARRNPLLPEVSRPALLQVVRLGLAALTLVAAVAAGDTLPVPVFDLARPTGAYLLVAALAEVVRLRRAPAPVWAVTGPLVVDVVYLSLVVALTGGPAGSLGFLVPVHLVSVSLLLSHRSGLRLAVGYSLLLIGGHYLAAPADGTVAATEANLAVTGFWAVALAVTAFSALNERELARGRDQLRALSELAGDLEQVTDPGELARLVVARISAAFDGLRVAVALAGTGGAAGAVATATDGTTTPPQPWDGPVPPRAARTRGTALVARLDPDDDGVLAAALAGAGNVVVVPLAVDGAVLGAVAIEAGGGAGARVGAAALAMLEHVVSRAALAVRNAQLVAELSRLARSDALTGLTNRRGFDESFARETARARRTAEPVTVVLIDIDHFKRVNDDHGHEVGDEVLRHVGRRLAETARSMDVCARIGGEEFVVLLPGCAAAEGLQAAERFRTAIADAAPLPVTASAGVATLGLHVDDPEALLGAADAALYEAKRAGRDRSEVAAAPTGPTLTV